MLLRLPLALVGWDREEQIVKLPLFKKFRERSDMPFCNFRAALQVCSPHRSTLLQNQHLHVPEVQDDRCASMPRATAAQGAHERHFMGRHVRQAQALGGTCVPSERQQLVWEASKHVESICCAWTPG